MAMFGSYRAKIHLIIPSVFGRKAFRTKPASEKDVLKYAKLENVLLNYQEEMKAEEARYRQSSLAYFRQPLR